MRSARPGTTGTTLVEPAAPEIRCQVGHHLERHHRRGERMLVTQMSRHGPFYVRWAKGVLRQL